MSEEKRNDFIPMLNPRRLWSFRPNWFLVAYIVWCIISWGFAVIGILGLLPSLGWLQ